MTPPDRPDPLTSSSQVLNSVMDRSSRPLSPKDDDSWGKLASDLFGIDLGPQDDFDFAEAEKPPAPPQPPVEEAAPVAAAPEADDEPLAEFAEGEDDAGDVPAEAEPAAERDEYWDALETWDWNEGEKAREKRLEGGQSSERTTRDDDRGPRGGGRPQRGRGGRNDAPRGERSRPPRGESRRSEQPEAARSESSEPKPAAPRRERAEGSGERRSQSDRPARRPSAEKSGTEARSSAPPSRPRPPVKKKPVGDDEFGAGLDEEFEDQDAGWETEPEEPQRAEFVPQERLDDDFAAGLDEERGEDSGADDQNDEEGRPKRRRRRRRRGRSPERSETTAGDEDFKSDRSADDLDDEESADDRELSTEDRAVDGEDVGDGEDRPRKRRRRRRRRPGSAPSEGAPARARSEEADDEDDDSDDRDEIRPAPTAIEQASHFDEVFEDEEEAESVQRVNYDDVPTWDEAISYLVKMPAGDSRGRGGRDQGNRGRRPPPRRPRSDSSPNA